MFQIKWTSEAEKRYLETLEFWIEHNQSSSYSVKIMNEVAFQEKLLSENPYIGHIINLFENEIRRS